MKSQPKPAQKMYSATSEGKGGLLEFLEVLEKIELTGPLAQLNEVSISDNNGGRIEL